MAPLRTALLLATLGLLPAVMDRAVAADVDRGRDLYEQRCGACHGQSVHARAKRRARDFNEVREWVERWSSVLELRWGPEEVEDVTLFLNNTFYRYAVPATGKPTSGHTIVSGDAPRH